MASAAGQGEQEPQAGPAIGSSPIHVGQFHFEVERALALFEDGHHDDAIRKASQRFINRVQGWVNRPDLEGVALLNKVFSSDNPLLTFNERSTPIERDEHDGYRYLAVGLASALRNVVTHHDNYGLDHETAWEWLVFISAMHRRLDQAEQVTEHSA